MGGRKGWGERQTDIKTETKKRGRQYRQTDNRMKEKVSE